MDLDAVIGELGTERAATVLRELLTRFLDPAFGALPKGEMELAVLDALVDIGAVSSTPQVYELVSKLKVTRSKSRKLIYERELRKRDERELDESVKKLLRHPIIRKSGDEFVLEVDNPLISDHLRARVKELGHVSDGSFSPSIVRLPIGAVTSLIESYLTEDDKERVTEALVRAGAPDPSFRGALRAMSHKLATKFASDTGAALADKAEEYIGAILDGANDVLVDKASDLFSSDEKKSG